MTLTPMRKGNVSNVGKESNTKYNEDIKSALAGVGRPMKVDCCLSSMLNLANLNAENMATVKAI